MILYIEKKEYTLHRMLNKIYLNFVLYFCVKRLFIFLNLRPPNNSLSNFIILYCINKTLCGSNTTFFFFDQGENFVWW